MVIYDILATAIFTFLLLIIAFFLVAYTPGIAILFLVGAIVIPIIERKVKQWLR